MSALNYSVAADWSALAHAMTSMQSAILAYHRLTYWRSRASKKRDRRRQQRARRQLKNLASLRAVFSAEKLSEVAQGWRDWKGPKTRVPRSLVALFGSHVGGDK